jgi:hypothetical protein
MFDSNKKIENRQLVIVFNDETEKIANYLYNKLSGTIDCVLWTTKVYKENVPKIKNTNKILMYDEDLIEELLPYQEKENITNLNCGAKFIQQGSRAGLVVDESFMRTEYSWRKGFPSMVLSTMMKKMIPFYSKFYSKYEQYDFKKFKNDKKKSILKVATDEILVHLLSDFIEGEKSTDC